MSALVQRFHSRPALVCVIAAHAVAGWAIAQAGMRQLPEVLPQAVEVVLLPDSAPQPLPQADAPSPPEPVSAKQPPKQARGPAQRKLPQPSAEPAPTKAAPPDVATMPVAPPAPVITEAPPASPLHSEARLPPDPPQPAQSDVSAPVELPVAVPTPLTPAPHITPAAETPPPAVAPSTARAADSAAASDAGAASPSYSAAYLRNPKPDYPLLSKRLGEQGVVTLRVLVTVDGNPQEVHLKASSGFVRLDDAAQDAVKRWRFTPAKRGDEAVAAWVLVPIRFSLKG